MKKCRYCGKELSNNFGFCCNECEDKYRKMVEKDSRKVKYFIIGIMVGFLIMFYGILSNNTAIIGAGIILMGMIVAALPFTTPETIALLGYQKSKIVGKILGILLMITGIWVSFLS